MNINELTSHYLKEMYLIKYGLDEQITERIESLVEKITFNDIEHIQLVDSCVEQMLSCGIEIEDIEELDTPILKKCLEEKCLYDYTTALICHIVPTSIEDLLKLSYDNETIYEVDNEVFIKFIDMYCNKERLPRVKIICGHACIDNMNGECFVEEFNTKEKALKYLTSCLTANEIDELYCHQNNELEL